MAMLKTEYNLTQWFLFITVMACAMMFDVSAVLANTENCTGHSDMVANSAAGQGVVTAVMQTIIGLLGKTSETLYEVVIDPNSLFIDARNAAILLAITLYGVMIIFNLANFKPGEILGIIFKIGMILMFTQPGGWQFFNTIIGDFFFGTMIEMIEIFTGNATGAVTTGYVGQTGMANRLTDPLSIFNWPMARIISTQFFITLIGSLFLPTYGIFVFVLLVWGGFNLLLTLVNALFTYIKCVVGLWFLFALAPIFLVLLLFSRTRNLFEGWINMVVQFTLEPILLFAFLAFFITIVTSSLGDILRVNWCWATMDGVNVGSSSELWWWRPVNVFDPNSNEYVPIEGGVWGILGNLTSGGDPNPKAGIFPLDLTDVMFFLLASYVAYQYTKFVPQIANELSASGLRLSVNAEAARNYFSSRGLAPEQVGSKLFESGKRAAR